ncbi:MAG: hypothetical protein ACJ77M_03870 [Thermoleophilaceae bacterium]
MEATRKTPRLSLSIVLIAIALSAALYAITAHSGPGKPHAASPQVALAAGTLAVGNSHDGSAILSAGGMTPGGAPQAGTVTITNGGSLPGVFSLTKNVTGGGALANLLHVAIVDQTTGATVYDGSVNGMDARALGTFAPGESHTYQFAVNFPDGGTPSSNSTGDNAARGVTATVDYVWSASADDSSAGTIAGGPGGPGGPGGTTGPGTLISKLVTLAGAGKQNPLKHKNNVLITVSCTKACDISAGGTLSVPNAAKAYRFKTVKKHLSKAGKTTIKLAIPKKALKALKKAIAKKKSSIAKVKVTAKGGGSSSNAQRTIVLKR